MLSKKTIPIYTTRTNILKNIYIDNSQYIGNIYIDNSQYIYILAIFINIFCQNAMVHYSNTQKVGSSITNAEKDERLPQAFFSSGGLELAIVKFGQAVILL